MIADTTDEMVVPASESAGKAKQQPALSRKERKIFKALAKALRKHNKLMKQEAERRRAEEEATEKANRRKDDSSTRGFFNKLGEPQTMLYLLGKTREHSCCPSSALNSHRVEECTIDAQSTF